MRLDKWFSIQWFVPVLVIFTVVCSLLLFSLVGQVEASTNRTAEILEVKGSVYINKAGGARTIVGYEGMLLHHGDHIKTGEQSSVIIKVLDREDVITISDKADLYISDLLDKLGNKKTSIFMWSGSMWVKATALITPEDSFEIHTPNSVMDIRGTNLFVGVHPTTREPTFMLASGRGEVKDKNDQKNSPVILLPSQQITSLFGIKSELNSYVSIVDLDDLINHASPAIIEALVKHKQAIDEENAEFIARQKAMLELGSVPPETQSLGIHSIDDLDRLSSNLDNLIGNILIRAIEQNKVDEATIQSIITQANKTLDKQLNLKDVKPLVLTNEQKARQEQVRQYEEKRKQQEEEEQKRLEELKNRNQQLMDRIEEQRKKLEEENRKAAEEAKKKAEEALRNSLSEAEREKFEERRHELEERNRREQPTPAPTPTPAPRPSPNPAPESDSDPVDTTAPILTIVSPLEAVWNNTGAVDLVIRTEQHATVTASVYGDNKVLASGIGAGMGTDVVLQMTDLEEGEYNFILRAMDAAGNVTIKTVPVINIDMQPPMIYHVDVPGEMTTEMRAEIFILAEEGATLQVLEGEQLIATELGRGEQDLVIIKLPFLSEGDHFFTIKAIDVAGNETIYRNENNEILFHMFVYRPTYTD